jgi:hypothetical protein
VSPQGLWFFRDIFWGYNEPTYPKENAMFKPVGRNPASTIEVGHYIIHKSEMWRVLQNINVMDGRLLILAHWSWSSDHQSLVAWAHTRNDEHLPTLVKIDE